MIVALDLDDASIIRTKYHLIRHLLERYPNMKLSLFFIPLDYEMEVAQMVRMYKDDRLIELKELVATGSVELIPHGLTHLPREFEKADSYTIKLALKAIEEIMKTNGLPYVKGFKAPFWLYNQNLVDIMNDMGWFIGINRDDPSALKTKKFYRYNLSIHEPFWKSTEPVWKLHGHMLGSDNDLEEHFLNLYKIPLDAEWKFVSELVEEVDA